MKIDTNNKFCIEERVGLLQKFKDPLLQSLENQVSYLLILYMLVEISSLFTRYITYTVDRFLSYEQIRRLKYPVIKNPNFVT